MVDEKLLKGIEARHLLLRKRFLKKHVEEFVQFFSVILTPAHKPDRIYKCARGYILFSENRFDGFRVFRIYPEGFIQGEKSGRNGIHDQAHVVVSAPELRFNLLKRRKHGVNGPAKLRKLVLSTDSYPRGMIPGLGNGVLQDILWKAKLSPRRKLNTLSTAERLGLFTHLKQTLAEMTNLGGRDTEKDLYANPGGYAVTMSAKNNGKPCPACGNLIVKEAYLGGSVYYCKECQKS